MLTCDLSGPCLPEQGAVPILEVGASVRKILLHMVVGDFESDVVEGVPDILYILRV